MYNNKRMKSTYATVDETIKMLQKVSRTGRGNYLVTCNEEYWLEKKNAKPLADDMDQTVNLGGYFDAGD